MAYGVKWEPHRREQCAIDAVKRVVFRVAPPGEYIIKETDYAWRFEEHTYASSDPWGDGDTYYFNTYVEIYAYPIIRRTPKGIWIGGHHRSWGPNTKRFVLLEAQKRWALPTIDEAIESYIARKKKQASIYQARADQALRCIAMIKRGPYALPKLVYRPMLAKDIGMEFWGARKNPTVA